MSLCLQQIPVLQDNYTYLVICEKTGLAACVDSPDASATRQVAKKSGVRLTTVLNTHHHWDHTGANEELLRQAPDLIVCGGAEDHDRIFGLTRPLHEDETINLGELSFKILFIPGHTKGHIAYVGHGVVFCGDTLFVGGCGKLFEGTAKQMLASLNKLASLPDETLVYCGHEYTQKNLEFALTLEPDNRALQKKYREVLLQRKQCQPTVPSTIGEEKTYNPFLRATSSELIENIGKKIQVTALDELSIFSATRLLKDVY